MHEKLKMIKSQKKKKNKIKIKKIKKGVIVFSLWIGFLLQRQQHLPATRNMLQMMDEFNQALMKMIMWVVDWTPIAVASLVAAQVFFF